MRYLASRKGRERDGFACHRIDPADLVWAAGSLCALSRIPFDAELLLEQFPPPYTELPVASIIHYDVLPEKRMSGAGLKLLAAFRKWAESRGVFELSVGINSGTDIGRMDRFLKRLGFRLTGGKYSYMLLGGYRFMAPQGAVFLVWRLSGRGQPRAWRGRHRPAGGRRRRLGPAPGSPGRGH